MREHSPAAGEAAADAGGLTRAAGPGRPGLLVALVVLGGIGLAASGGGWLPAPQPVDASPERFSAARALRTLKMLLPEDAPHPIGSDENRRVRDRLVAAFQQLGYAPEVQRSFVCNSAGECGTVENVVARRVGGEPGPVVLLSAHYDSLPAGPGAADDGAGVASLLEIARALAAGPAPARPIAFLVTDGEEVGRLGALAFVSGHPLAASVRAVINLEARGSAGPSLMFETGPGNARLVELYARSARRPATSSLLPLVYRRMPNKTDFTVFTQRGMTGINLAFLSGVSAYHSPLDGVESVSAESVQAQGDSALGMARALAGPEELGGARVGDAVFFDVLGLTVVWWPERWTAVLAAFGLLLLGAGLARPWRRGALRLRALGAAVGLTPGALVAGGAAGWALALALRAAGAFPGRWPATSGLAFAAFVALGFAVALALGAFASRLGFWATWGGVWLVWGLAGLAVALWEPAASYLLLVPALVAGLLALVAEWLPRRPPALEAAQVLMPLAAAACLWFPLASLLFDAAGVDSLPILSALLGMVGVSLAPLLGALGPRGRWLLPAAAGVAALVAAVIVAASAPYDPRAPRPLNLVFLQEEDGPRARWLLTGETQGLPAELRDEAALARWREQSPLPWEQRRYVPGPQAQPLAMASPELTVLESVATGSGGRRVRARIGSPRGAPVLSFILPPSARLESATLQGTPLPALAPDVLARTGGWRVYTCFTVSAEGLEVTLELGDTSPIEVYLLDSAPGLPAADVRPLPGQLRDAMAVGHGHRVAVLRKVFLP